MGMEVPWFARPPVYTEEEVEMYPLYASEPLNLIVKKKSRKSPTSRDCPNLPLPPPPACRREVLDEREGGLPHVPRHVLQQGASWGKAALQRLPDQACQGCQLSQGGLNLPW